MTAASVHRRWLAPAALALFAGIPCLLATLTVANLLRWLEADAALEEHAVQIARIERRIRSAPPSRGAALDAGRIYLEATTATLAQAELQARLVGLIERAGARLVEVRVDLDGPSGDPHGAIVSATFDAVNARLVDVITSVEASLPLLAVDALDARVAPGRMAGGTDEDPILRVALTVRAAWKGARS